MAVQAQFGGFFAGSLPCGDGIGEEQLRALLSAAAVANNNGYHCPGVVSGAQSELTCNGGSGGVFPSRKRGRDADYLEQYVSSSPSSAALLPIPASRIADSAVASTSGRIFAGAQSSAPDALMVAELCAYGGAEVDALVRAECERLRAALEQATKRQRQELVGAVAAVAAWRLREKEAEVQAARRRAAELEERLRQAAAESQAWLGVARSNEAVAAGLRATLDHVLLRAASASAAGGAVAVAPLVEGFGDFSPAAEADDAQSCCFGDTGAPADEAAAATSPAAKWACKACGDHEATVLLLPCRHLCLCKSCEPRADACPVCLATKNASIHVAAN